MDGSKKFTQERRQYVMRYLATLAARDTPESSKYEIETNHEMKDFIVFKSQTEVLNCTETSIEPLLKDITEFNLPEPPNISEDEFMRIQESIQKKSFKDTMEEFYAGVKKRRRSSHRDSEANAVDLTDVDEWEDLDDDYETSEDSFDCDSSEDSFDCDSSDDNLHVNEAGDADEECTLSVNFQRESSYRQPVASKRRKEITIVKKFGFLSPEGTSSSEMPSAKRRKLQEAESSTQNMPNNNVIRRLEELWAPRVKLSDLITIRFVEKKRPVGHSVSGSFQEPWNP